MAFSRAVARTMLASVFVSQGIKAVIDPSVDRAQAEMMRDRVAPMLSQVAPASLAGMIPEDATTWARVRGVVKVLAAVGLSTGIGRRGAAAVLAACTVQDMVATGQLSRKGFAGGDTLGKVALTGGLLLAAQDTEGHPGLGYRAQKAGGKVQKKGKRAVKALGTDAQKAVRTSRRTAKQAGKKAQSVLAD